MASLETPQKIISLGKLLVESLGENSDTFSRWMAHYIAELMSTAEAAEEEQKEQAQKRCFDTILTLWKHRSELRGDARPFTDFDTVLATLERLDPKPQRPFYWHTPEPLEDLEDESSRNIMKAIQATDEAARSLINELVTMAVQERTSDTTRAYLDNWPDEDADSNEFRVMFQLQELFETAPRSAKEKAIAKITERLEILDRFTHNSLLVREIMVRRLAELRACYEL